VNHSLPSSKTITLHLNDLHFFILLCIQTILICTTDSAKILDLCCGQGRHSLYLANKYPNLKLFGHDQSSYLISVAGERAKELQLTSNTTFTVGDCRKIPYPDSSFDFVMVMGNSFGYFSSEDGDKAVLAEISRVLVPGGLMVLDLVDGGLMKATYSPRSWEWIDDKTFVCRERQLSRDNKRLISREVITSTTSGVVRDQFYQERLYERVELENLVREAGLNVGNGNTLTASDDPKELVDDKRSESSDGLDANGNEKVSVKDETGSLKKLSAANELSKRGEDLGMMGHRVVITGHKPGLRQEHVSSPLNVETVEEEVISVEEKPKPETSSRYKEISISHGPQPLFENMMIVMGDPSQSCFGKLNNTWNEEDFITRAKLRQALYDLGYTDELSTTLESHSTLYRDLETLAQTHNKAFTKVTTTKNGKLPTFAFNLCDEGFDNDALRELHVPAILEMLHIPYSGAGPNCLSYCYDKGLVNRTAGSLGIPTPREVFYLRNVETPNVSSIDELHHIIMRDVQYPAFIKPMKGDNSLGITTRSIVNSKAELEVYMRELEGLGLQDLIVQEYLQGTEYGVGVVGNLETGFHFFPILEVDFSKIVEKDLPPILGFESKWDPASPYWTDISYKRATLHPDVERALKSYCVTLWDRFGCRDYARFDFRADVGKADGYSGNGTIKLLEVNPNPGWCWDGKLAYMGKLDGKDYKDMIGMILKAAHDRLVREQQERLQKQ
jgi:D-alanine-D-alanine ligase